MSKSWNVIIFTATLIMSTLSGAMTPSSITDAKHKPILLNLFKTVYNKNDVGMFAHLMSSLNTVELQAIWADLLDLFIVGFPANTELVVKNRTFYDAMKKENEQRESPLHKAVRAGLIDQITLLINPRSLNYTNSAGETPLFVAVSKSTHKNDIDYLKLQYQMAELLLRSGANPCIASTAGLTPLVASQSPLIAQMLLNFGAGTCINKQDRLGNSVLMNAIAHAQEYDKALFFINAGINPNIQNQFGFTALHLAAANQLANVQQSMNLLEKLLAAGAQINIQTNDGNTPLHYAIESKEPLTVGLLLARNADVTIKNNAGVTPQESLARIWHMTPQEFSQQYRKPAFKKMVAERSFQVPDMPQKKTIKAPATLKKIKKDKLTYNQRHEKKLLQSNAKSATPPRLEITQNALGNMNDKQLIKPKESVVTAQTTPKEITPALAQRLIDWRNDTWLANEKQKAKDEGQYEYWKFMQGRVYHRLPDSVIQTIVKYGKTSQRPNETYKDFIDTVYTLKGEIQFENLTNPWNPGKLTQPGYYHVTKGKFDKIYHIGFKATQDAIPTLSDFMPSKGVPVEWVSQETPQYFAVYDKGESVRHVLYLEK